MGKSSPFLMRMEVSGTAPIDWHNTNCSTQRVSRSAGQSGTRYLPHQRSPLAPLFSLRLTFLVNVFDFPVYLDTPEN